MKAIIQHRYGAPDVLELREIDRPAPSEHEVLVRVQAASANARDWHVTRGDPRLARLMMGLRRPKSSILGTDFAGRVESVGPGVQRFSPGDEVYGEVEGAFAEYICAPDDLVEAKPTNLTFEQAAAMPTAANTALMGLRDLGQVQAGQQVLVNGASGGVGTFAVQIGKAYGAQVTGVCSTRNVELVRSLGADQVIDYTQQDFTSTGQRYDVIFDLVGNRALTDLRRALTPSGMLVLSGGGVFEGGSLVGPLALILKGQLASHFVKQRLLQLTAKPSAANLATLREMALAGQIVPAIDRTYPLSEVPAAIRYLETEHARAKVVITL